MRSFGGADEFSTVISRFRVCFVRALSVLALLDRGLAPRRFGRRGFELHVFCECLANASVIASVIASASAIANAGANANASANASASFWGSDR